MNTLNYSSAVNYQKIYLSDSAVVNIAAFPPADTTYTIFHGLGHIPTLRLFIDDGTNLYQASAPQNYFADLTSAFDAYCDFIRISTENVFVDLTTFSGNAATITLYWRIYLDG